MKMNLMLKIALQKFNHKSLEHKILNIFNQKNKYIKPILQQLRNVYLITLCLQNNNN